MIFSMTSYQEISQKLTTRNILALATTGVFLWSIVFMFQHFDQFFTLFEVVEDLEPVVALSVGGAGGLILGAFLMVVKDVYQFFFRKKEQS